MHVYWYCMLYIALVCCQHDWILITHSGMDFPLNCNWDRIMRVLDSLTDWLLVHKASAFQFNYTHTFIGDLHSAQLHLVCLPASGQCKGAYSSMCVCTDNSITVVVCFDFVRSTSDRLTGDPETDRTQPALPTSLVCCPIHPTIHTLDNIIYSKADPSSRRKRRNSQTLVIYSGLDVELTIHHL